VCNVFNQDVEGGTYELYTVGKGHQGEEHAPEKGLGLSAVFVSRTRFAILDQQKQIQLKSFNNETKKRFPAPVASVNYLFSAGIDRILMRSPDRMILYDLRTKKVVNELSVQSRHPIKYVIWSKDRKYVALLSKFFIYIANSRLQELCTISENARVKSGAWDANGVFFYSTTTHIKYCLVSGDNGIVRTLEDVIYITGVEGQTVFFLDREAEPRILNVDVTEALFKRALITRNLDEVKRIVQSDSLIGQSIIAYLQKKGYPDVALYFVQDEKTKFSLALQCGKLKIAKECAAVLNDPECWEQLGLEALKQGDHSLVEVAYMKTKNFEKLAFLYLILGNIPKLSRMLEIAQARKDVMGRFHTALYLGNVEERVKVLTEAEQYSLAYITAVVHNLPTQAAELGAALGDAVPDMSQFSSSKLFTPPSPVFSGEDWPKREIKKGYFDDAGAAPMVPADDDKVEDYQDEDEEGRPVASQPAKGAADVDMGWGDSAPAASVIFAIFCLFAYASLRVFPSLQLLKLM
jgi:coatomer protein complex subunit alpha (xenin)